MAQINDSAPQILPGREVDFMRWFPLFSHVDSNFSRRAVGDSNRCILNSRIGTLEKRHAETTNNLISNSTFISYSFDSITKGSPPIWKKFPMARLAFLLSWILQSIIIHFYDQQTWFDLSLLLTFCILLSSFVGAFFKNNSLKKTDYHKNPMH